MRYPGGKNGAGVYQTIINQMPPHLVYIEPFVGSGAILRSKKAAALATIAADLDRACLEALKDQTQGVEFYNLDAFELLRQLEVIEREYRVEPEQVLIYLDPPYLMETRRGKKKIYRFEMGEEEKHIELLGLVRGLRNCVMLSGYPSDLYERELAGWRKIEFSSTTRAGMAVENLWMNFPESAARHDYQYFGENYRTRENFRRKKTRWLRKLYNMSENERSALMAALQEIEKNES